MNKILLLFLIIAINCLEIRPLNIPLNEKELATCPIERVQEFLLTNDINAQSFFSPIKNDYLLTSWLKIRNYSNWTLLMIAIKAGRLDIVNFLMNAGADVNQTNAEGDTPLMIASDYGNLEIAKTLITAGANINATTLYSNTALIRATKYINIVNLLINNKVNVNAVDIFGNSALITAAYHGYTETVNALIKAGADLNIQESFGETALMIAIKEKI